MRYATIPVALLMIAQTVWAQTDPAAGDGQKYSLPPLEMDNEVGAQGQARSNAESVYVSTIRVEGSTVLTSTEIATIVGPYEGRGVNSAELQAIRSELSKLYVSKGYINSGVILPNQEVTDGVVVYQAIEGELTRIEIEGDPYLSDAYISSRIRQYQSGPLNLNDI